MYIIISVVISYLLGFLVSARVYSSLIICGGGRQGRKYSLSHSTKILKDLLCAKSGGDKKGPAFREAVF